MSVTAKKLPEAGPTVGRPDKGRVLLLSMNKLPALPGRATVVQPAKVPVSNPPLISSSSALAADDASNVKTPSAKVVSKGFHAGGIMIFSLYG